MSAPGLMRTARRARDGAIVATGVAAAVIQGLAGVWAALAVAVIGAGGWVWLRRSRLVDERRAGPVVQAIFVVLGVLLVWRLDFRVFALAVAGMWMLVTAADLDRFVQRFPAGSPAVEQRAAFRRRLQWNGLVAGATVAVVLPGAVLSLRLQLVAVMLLAAFVVIVALRVLRQIPNAGSEEDERG